MSILNTYNTYRFEKTLPDGRRYSDAIMLPMDHTLTDEEILARQEARFEQWITAITRVDTLTDIVPEVLPDIVPDIVPE